MVDYSKILSNLSDEWEISGLSEHDLYGQYAIEVSKRANAELIAQLAAITAERDAYAYALDDGHMAPLLEILFGVTKSELEAKLADVTAERDALQAELDALRNQKPVGEWKVFNKGGSGEFGRFISEQRFEDGQKFYTSPVMEKGHDK